MTGRGNKSKPSSVSKKNKALKNVGMFYLNFNLEWFFQLLERVISDYHCFVFEAVMMFAE